MKSIGFMLSLAITATAAFAQTPAFDPRSWKGKQAGAPTQVLVLGTAHLSELKPPYQPAYLAPVLDRLAAFNPQIITIESLSGEQCDLLLRHKAYFANAWDDYCRGTAEAEKATGLTVAAAMDAIEKTLAAWPAQPSAAERRQLASLFLAANDRSSAQVQWLQLAPAERRAGDGLDAALVAILERKGAKGNENIDVAAALAARLGLQRVYPTDDHTADATQASAGPGMGEALQKIWGAPNPPPLRAEYMKRIAAIDSPAAALDFFRFMNSPATQIGFISSDHGAALAQPSPENYGRSYVGWWEVRNLRMVANIRAAFAPTPGVRVLAVVGASHKAYFDAYLDMMHEVQLVDAEQILK